jgi:diguanylate cyclase (GGDEF)-like protein/PAS domain S-box-containing protein
MTLELGESAFSDAGIPMVFVEASGERGGLGTIHSANGAMAYFTGRSQDSLAGLAFAELVHRDDVAIGEDQVARLINGESHTCSFEKRFEHADGHRTWGLITLAPARVNTFGLGRPLIVQLQDISERKHFLGQLEYFADHDPLTSLYNQRRFRIEVDRQLAYVRRHGGGGAVLMLDLDHFKSINDQFGHAAGDALIIAVATALVANSRETDVVARLGGDEFAIILPESTLNEATGHAESILTALRGVVVDGAGQGMNVAASCGVAGFLSNDGQCADDVLMNADLALYQVKESGRGRVQVFHSDSGLHEKVHARLLWSERIRDALDNNGFVLHAKPVINLLTDDVAFYELLIRLRAPGGILIPPEVFLYTAERFGMAISIDEWVTSRAIQLLEQMDPAGRLALGVNLSGTSLQGKRFITFLQDKLATTSFPRHLLLFELSETVAMANLECARQFKQSLVKLGCRLALDDFGAAFGSFFYLKHLRVDVLKIDGEYVRGLGTDNDPTDCLIIEALVKLAKGLGTIVVAEFVGDQETRQKLLAMGVHLGQGVFLGPSRDIQEVEALQPDARRCSPEQTSHHEP